MQRFPGKTTFHIRKCFQYFTSVLQASPEVKNKARWKHDTELTLTFFARSDLKSKSSIMQHKNNSFKYRQKGRTVVMSLQNNCSFVSGQSYEEGRAEWGTSLPLHGLTPCLAPTVKNCEGEWFCCVSVISQPNPEADFSFMSWVQVLFHKMMKDQ